MSIGEMEELEKARTRVRKGRIARIERERVIFTSNQVDIMVMVMAMVNWSWSWWCLGGIMRVARIEKERVDRSSSHQIGLILKNSPRPIPLFQEIPTNAQTLHIDCSAAGIKLEAGVKIFDG